MGARTRRPRNDATSTPASPGLDPYPCSSRPVAMQSCGPIRSNVHDACTEFSCARKLTIKFIESAITSAVCSGYRRRFIPRLSLLRSNFSMDGNVGGPYNIRHLSNGSSSTVDISSMGLGILGVAPSPALRPSESNGRGHVKAFELEQCWKRAELSMSGPSSFSRARNIQSSVVRGRSIFFFKFG